MDNIKNQVDIFEVLNYYKKNPEALKNKSTKKSRKVSFMTLDQKILYNKFRNTEKVARAIAYNCGAIAIEVYKSNSIQTYGIDRSSNVFSFGQNNRSGVLPMDKIFYYAEEEEITKNTNVQIERLDEILSGRFGKTIKKVIKRKADYNIIIETDEKVISILPNGWILDFFEQNINYQEDEIYMEIKK